MTQGIMGGNVSQMNDLYLLEKKLEILADTNSKKILNELSNLKAAVLKLNTDVLELRSQLSNNSSARAEAARTEPIRIEPTPAVAENKAAEAISNDFEGFRLIPNNTPPNTSRGGEPLKPRFGDYKSDDVPIEKFFYFGNKRR